MYRGVVQEAIYWTDYLRDYIKARDLEQPISLGRIWRIVHDTTQARPQAGAVEGHAGGAACRRSRIRTAGGAIRRSSCWSQRGDTSVVPRLKQLAVADARLAHAASCALDARRPGRARRGRRPTGAGRQVARRARVRTAAVGAMAGRADEPIARRGLKLIDDPSWTVRRQLAATIGELPQPARLDAAVSMLTRYGADPVTVDATISGLRGREADVLERVAQAQSTDVHADAVTMLAAAVARSGEVAAVQQVIARIGGPRTAPMAACRASSRARPGLVAPGGGRGGGRGGRGAGQQARPSRYRGNRRIW